MWEDLCSALFRVISFSPILRYIFSLPFAWCWFLILVCSSAQTKELPFKFKRGCCEELLMEYETNRMFQDRFKICFPSKKYLATTSVDSCIMRGLIQTRIMFQRKYLKPRNLLSGHSFHFLYFQCVFIKLTTSKQFPHFERNLNSNRKGLVVLHGPARPLCSENFDLEIFTKCTYGWAKFSSSVKVIPKV